MPTTNCPSVFGVAVRIPVCGFMVKGVPPSKLPMLNGGWNATLGNGGGEVEGNGAELPVVAPLYGSQMEYTKESPSASVAEWSKTKGYPLQMNAGGRALNSGLLLFGVPPGIVA